MGVYINDKILAEFQVIKNRNIMICYQIQLLPAF